MGKAGQLSPAFFCAECEQLSPRLLLSVASTIMTANGLGPLSNSDKTHPPAENIQVNSHLTPARLVTNFVKRLIEHIGADRNGKKY